MLYYYMSEQLLNQGGYGCVYFPAKTCLSNIESERFVTKVQVKSTAIEQEEVISKVILTIADYASFFAPVVESCAVQETDINEALLDDKGEKCKIFEKARGKELIMLRIPYIPDGDFVRHIKKRPISELISCYRHLLMSVEHLINKKVVHYDLKAQNILLNRRLNNPIIIDFGLSFLITEVDKNNLKSVFYVYEPEYILWPLDVHLLCLIASTKSIKLSEIEKMCSQYVRKAFSPPQQAQAEEAQAQQAHAQQAQAQQAPQAQPAQAQQAQAQQAQAEQAQSQQAQAEQAQQPFTAAQKIYYDKAVKYYSTYKDPFPRHEAVELLLKNWATWDLYAIHMMFYKLSAESKHMDERDIFTKYTHELMYKELSPDPTDRKKSSELMENIQKIYYLS